MLYPTTGGNLHSFTTVASCAILDVLALLYLEKYGRHCTYYHDYPYVAFPGKSIRHFLFKSWKFTSKTYFISWKLVHPDKHLESVWMVVFNDIYINYSRKFDQEE